MPRLLAISAFALCLAVPVWAQHGGGHGGGGHAGFGGGHASGGFGGHSGISGGGHFSGGHISGGMRSGPGITHGFSTRPNRGPFLHNGFTGSRLNSRFGSRGHFGGREHFRTYGFRNNCYGWRCGAYSPWGWGYYDPWFWGGWNSDSSYNDDYYQNLAAANEMNRQSLDEQRMLRQEEADGDRDAYANSAPAPRSSANDKQADPILPPTVLVFRDHRRQEVQNYAIVGQTLWNFAPQHTQKIPLSDLDLPATTKANEDQGVTFRVPSASEGQ